MKIWRLVSGQMIFSKMFVDDGYGETSKVNILFFTFQVFFFSKKLSFRENERKILSGNSWCITMILVQFFSYFLSS